MALTVKGAIIDRIMSFAGCFPAMIFL